MSEAPFVAIVGGGPAGLSAAVALARSGMHVLLVEQRDRLGGAIHRQPATAGTPHLRRPSRHARAWRELTENLAASRDRITVAASTVFSGVDGNGYLLLDNRKSNELFAVKPAGLVLALGATERIIPFPGWELPDVMSVGGAQVLLKETGAPLPGRTLIAGTGPLLLAFGAQLCSTGQPPVAIVERGRPFHHPAAAASILASFAHMKEGLGYAAQLAASRVPYVSGSHVLKAVREGDDFVVTVLRNGRPVVYRVQNLIVHDGVRADHPTIGSSDTPFPTVEAGDGREILGADAAIVDGRLAAASLMARLGRHGCVASSSDDRAIRAARAIQQRLTALFEAPLPPFPSETVLCRCEGRRVSDLPAGVSSREAKLVGRFGMGACQGRFCIESTARALGDPLGGSAFRPAIARWPIKPLSAGSLSRLRYLSTDFEKIWNDDPAID